MNQFAVPNATAGLPGRPANGGSSPRFYDFDDGVARLVKWHPSPHGNKACVNELVACRLGLLIDSPILRGGVVYVPEEIIPADHRPQARAGFHFAVARMQGQNFVPTDHYDEIENTSQLAAAAVHLAWLQVGDQEDHNQFLQRLETGALPPAVAAERRLFRLIDMGFMFGDPGWTAARIAALPDRYGLPRHLADKLTMAQVDAAISELMAVGEDKLRACFQELPDVWNVAQADIDAAAEYVVSVRPRLRDIIIRGNMELANRA
jgi:hypothetical protein